MDVNRTFGVEIEMSASVGRERLATILRTALESVGHSVRVGDYSHATDANNTTMWMVESDGSLRSTSPDHPYTMEVKTPVLKGVEGLKALKIATSVLSSVGHINKSCGLHVHHFIHENERGQHLRNLCNAWIENERHFMKCLPPSRHSNGYCKQWRGKPSITATEDIRYYIARNLGRKYTLNLTSLYQRGTVEFRMHSGTYEFEKISNWLIATQRFIIKAMRGDFIFQKSNTFDEFVQNMEVDFDQEVMSRRTATVTAQSSTSSAASVDHLHRGLIHPDASKKKLPRPGTKAHTIATLLLRGATKEEIIEALDAEHGSIGYAKQKKFVAGQLTNMKNPKYSWGFRIQKNRRNGKYRIVPHEGNGAEVNEATPIDESSPEPLRIASKLDLRSLHWLKSRCEFFNAQRQTARAGGGRTSNPLEDALVSEDE